MKRNLLITTMLVALSTVLLPINSHASNNVNQEPNFLLKSSIPYVYQVTSSDTSITWTLDSSQSKTRSIYFSKGTTITISAVISSSSSASARIGIIDPDDTYHTTSIDEYGTFSYTITSSGTYKIYCKNTSSSSYSIVINYTTN